MDRRNTRRIRDIYCAGTFYQGNDGALREQVTGMLEANAAPSVPGHICAIVSPHAGYMFSGAVAATGYQQLTAAHVTTVIIVAPSHRPFAGISLYSGDGYATPLGEVPIDHERVELLAHPPAGEDPLDMRLSTEGHESEHSLEVQLPFLQVALGDFHLVPIIVGRQEPAECRRLGERLGVLLQDEKCVLVASSDLSHMHPYDEAVMLDSRVAARLETFDVDGFSRDWRTRRSEACGAGPILTAMVAAGMAGANHGRVLSYRNSGDVSGDTSAVVGYLSAAFYREEPC